MVSLDFTFVSSCCFCKMKGKLFDGSTLIGTIGGVFPPTSTAYGEVEPLWFFNGEGLMWAGKGSCSFLSGDSSGVGDYWFRYKPPG